MGTSAPLTIHTIFPIKSLHKVAFRNPQLRDQFNAAPREITQMARYAKSCESIGSISNNLLSPA